MSSKEKIATLQKMISRGLTTGESIALSAKLRHGIAERVIWAEHAEALTSGRIKPLRGAAPLIYEGVRYYFIHHVDTSCANYADVIPDRKDEIYDNEDHWRPSK